MNKKQLKRVARTGEPLIKLHVLGSAGAVTGSLLLFEYFERESVTRVLVDVGLHVDNEKADFTNRLPSGITAADVDVVVISHAHIDHSGYLPKLIKDGFKGRALTTHATHDLLMLLLPDCGYLQEEAARRANERADRQRRNQDGQPDGGERRKRGGKQGRQSGRPRGSAPTQSTRVPLYTREDGVAALKRIDTIGYDTRHNLADNIAVKFTEAGHILGAGVVTLEFGSGRHKRTFCFTGNIGRPNMPLLRDLEPVAQADYVMTESTYGNRLHQDRDRLETLEGIINRAFERAKTPHPKFGCGVILIPAFAIGRAQTVISDLRELMEAGRIPVIPVYVDSPMTVKSNRIHRKHIGLLNAATQKVAESRDPFSTPEFYECEHWEDSVHLHEPQSKPIIVIGSGGMAQGGRIVNHLKERLAGRQNTVVFVGYQGTGTLGNALVGQDARATMCDGTTVNCGGPVRTVRVMGKPVRVNATIEFMSDYSAHADVNDILAWLRHFYPRPKAVFLVHGDEKALEGLAGAIETKLHWKAVVPKTRDSFILE